VRSIVFRFIKPVVKIPNSYAQAGEDVVMNFLFQGIGIKHPSYLELGVHHPDDANNTYKFYMEGSRGVLVEANPSLIPKIREKRPEDVVLNFGVGVTNEKAAQFFVFDEPGISTFDQKEADLRSDSGAHKLVTILSVEIKSITDILEENFKRRPDLLSIDIEGLDLAVLESLDTKKHPIPVICVETCVYSENHIRPKDHRIGDYMASIGYFPYADTYINTIYVNKDWFYSLEEK
jgi:FkbM family methyltransferase